MIKHNKKLLMATLALLLTSFSFLLTGCDGIFSVYGKVYEWIDAPEGISGEMYVDMEPPTHGMMRPLSGVNVFWKYSYFTSYDYPDVTDSNGIFHHGQTAAPGARILVDVKVEKAGYQTFTGRFQTDTYGEKNKHSLTIFMVRQ